MKIGFLEVLEWHVVSEFTGSHGSCSGFWTTNHTNDWRSHTSVVSSNLGILVGFMANFLGIVSEFAEIVTQMMEGEMEILKLHWWKVVSELTSLGSISAVFVTGKSCNDWSGSTSVMSGNSGILVGLMTILIGIVGELADAVTNVVSQVAEGETKILEIGLNGLDLHV